jgi:hypothetical protein
MGGEQNLGFGLIGVSIKPASPSLMRYFSSNTSYYKDTGINATTKQGFTALYGAANPRTLLHFEGFVPFFALRSCDETSKYSYFF